MDKAMSRKLCKPEMTSFALTSFRQIFTVPFRKVLWKSLGLTIGLFVLIWFGLQALLAAFTIGPWPWIDTAIAVVAGAALFAGLVFIMAPVTALFAGLFLDEIAETVERVHYPGDPPGRELAILPALWMALKFTALVVLVNLTVVLVILLPGLNFLAWIAGLWANAYLLGREYFQMVGARHMPLAKVKAIRAANKNQVLFAGGAIALLASVPFINLLVPLFATSFMVHVFKDVSKNADFARAAREF
jgi:CysZ protein